MLTELLQHADTDERLRTGVAEYIAQVRTSAGRGDRRQVARAEAEVMANPGGGFQFLPDGSANLVLSSGTVSAGRFATPSLNELKQRLGSGTGSIRLFVLDGGGPATDIGSLQAFATPGTLFQVASQFNCLEAPSAFIVPVAEYFDDSTQGPRASISAYTGTLLRHYAAPAENGTRFTQELANQLNLLQAVCEPGVARVMFGYLKAKDIADTDKLAKLVEERFDQLRIGLHDDVPVQLGHNWDGGVSGDVRIAQAFTSTLAAGMYSTEDVRKEPYSSIVRWLLRAAYLGTILGAATLRRYTVVLTLIGGGVFGNPASIIWESILWAINEAERFIPADMTVVLNGHNLGQQLSIEMLMPEIRTRHGYAVVFGHSGVNVLR
jgi:hypothetical protein